MLIERPGYRLGLCPAAEASAARPADWLSPGELAAYAGLGAGKRRLDWLAGRIAAKRAGLGRAAGPAARPQEIEVAPDPGGRPRLRVVGPGAGAAVPDLSISHGDWGGLAAVASSGGPVGADIEGIRELPRAALELFLDDEELAAAGRAGAGAAIRAWTLKEAALKLLGAGPALSLRDVRPRGDGVELSGGALRAWRSAGAPRLTADSFELEGSWVGVVHG